MQPGHCRPQKCQVGSGGHASLACEGRAGGIASQEIIIIRDRAIHRRHFVESRLPSLSPPPQLYHSSSQGVCCFCATRDMSIICGPQSTRPRALKSCSQSEHHQGKQNLFLHHFFQFMYNYTSAVSGTCACVARSLTLIYAGHPMTPNVFETDTLPRSTSGVL